MPIGYDQPESRLCGLFDIEFVGDPQPRKLRITRIIQNYHGNILCLIENNGTVYNWSTIIKMVPK